jgi:methylenetetrahydrofolate dehydrogenase (NADP+) / methenyltetrahydrofolate cyclohydrolase
MKIIDGKKIAEKINSEVFDELRENPEIKPGLAIILVGDRKDSEIYVRLKKEKAGELGIEAKLFKFSAKVEERDVLDKIEEINKDKNIHAVLIQLPLPKKFDTDKIIKAMDPEKDVDRFHPENLEILLSTCSHGDFIPPVFQVVLEILEEINCEIKNKKIVVVSNSEIFGKSLSKILSCREGVVENAFPDDVGLASKTKKADILIIAVGKAGFIKKDMIKDGVVIIDIGITQENKRVLGDVDFDSVKNKASFITPVPGGVGPITVAVLMRNVLRLARKK